MTIGTCRILNHGLIVLWELIWRCGLLSYKGVVLFMSVTFHTRRTLVMNSKWEWGDLERHCGLDLASCKWLVIERLLCILLDLRDFVLIIIWVSRRVEHWLIYIETLLEIILVILAIVLLRSQTWRLNLFWRLVTFFFDFHFFNFSHCY